MTKDVPPDVMAAGNYASLYGLNLIGLKRRGFSEETIAALKKVYKIFFRSSLTVAKAIEKARAEVPDLPEVEDLRGVHRTVKAGRNALDARGKRANSRQPTANSTG